MPVLRCSFLWEDSRNGWSETLYHRSQDRAEVYAAALRLLPLRYQLTGQGSKLTALRISDDTLRRDAWVHPREALPPPLPLTPHSGLAAPANWALLIQLRYGTGIWNPLYLRGIPKQMHNAEAFTPDAFWVDSFKRYSALLASDQWGMLHRNPGIVPPPGWPANGPYQVWPIGRTQTRYLRSRSCGRPFRPASWEGTSAASISPCGSIVDYLRSCYWTTAQTGPDASSPAIVMKWYWAPVGAEALPFWTAFGSGNWARVKAGWDGPGELLGDARPWSAGGRLGAQAGHSWCGEEDYWQAGTDTPDPLPRACDGSSLCCSPAIPGCEEAALAAVASVSASLGVKRALAADLHAYANLRGRVCRTGYLSADLAAVASMPAALSPIKLLTAHLNAQATVTAGLTRHLHLSALLPAVAGGRAALYRIGRLTSLLASRCALMADARRVVTMTSALPSRCAVSGTIRQVVPMQAALAARSACSSTITPVHPIASSIRARAGVVGAVLVARLPGCNGGARVAKQFTFTVAGVTNGGCTGCATMNNAYTLTLASACVWTTPTFSVSCPATTTCQWTLQLSAINVWQLSLAPSNMVLYSVTSSTWDAQSDLTLSRVSFLPACATWPASITIHPV